VAWKVNIPFLCHDTAEAASSASTGEQLAATNFEGKWHTAAYVLIFTEAVHGTCKAPWSGGK